MKIYKVEEKLPDVGSDVLVYIDDKRRKVGAIRVSMQYKMYAWNPAKYTARGFSLPHVTKWMYPPGDGDEGN